MLGMLRLWRSDVLKKLGWKLLLQIHDEVILEGPKESRDEVSVMYVCMHDYISIILNLKRMYLCMYVCGSGNEGGARLHGKSVCWKLHERTVRSGSIFIHVLTHMRTYISLYENSYLNFHNLHFQTLKIC